MMKTVLTVNPHLVDDGGISSRQVQLCHHIHAAMLGSYVQQCVALLHLLQHTKRVTRFADIADPGLFLCDMPANGA
jgi:hypothetical protein